MATPAGAVLKEKDLKQTLSILREELTTFHNEQARQSLLFKRQSEQVRTSLFSILQRSNQNALMLYSQKPDYVFDLTYACNEASDQYHEFKTKALPFRTFIGKLEWEIARYDSLIQSLKTMPVFNLDEKAKIDRNVCLTLATNIKNTMEENQQQMSDYVRYYDMADHRLKTLNDYAQKRYAEIQNNIFKNAGENYFSILKKFRSRLKRTSETVTEKYQPTRKLISQWDSRIMFGLFGMILLYAVIAILLNILVIRFLMPKRYRTTAFMSKRNCIIMATTTITFALTVGIIMTTAEQNFIIMASNLLVEYAWLLGVILISLLLRVDGKQINSAFHIYTPLIVIGFIVIAFRIILIPNELVDLIFPPILLICALWQWLVIRRHNENIPHSDVFYTYISLLIFIISVICSWSGYTLMSVQILIWWIMQLTCILTITCISRYVKLYGIKHGLENENKPITKTWMYKLFYHVVLPIAGVASVLYSIYWAADVFNLSDLCWKLFHEKFVNFKNLQISMMKLAMVISLWFIFSYISSTILALMRLHYHQKDPHNAESRMVMGKNVIQVLVWGIWLLLSLSLLHISVAWLVAISGGLSTGIGFASKDIIENIYYGASLMAGRIKVGDWIEVDGTMGKVTSISYTSTMIESLFGEVIAFQNSQLFAKNYKNLTKNHGYVLAVVPFGVAYGSNLKEVGNLIEKAVNDLHHPWMDPVKQVKAVVSEMGDNSVNYKLFVWADAVKKSYVVSDVMKCIYETLNEHDISIPFPQRDIHIINS
jgi:small-conductance mechanosensitive channel